MNYGYIKLPRSLFDDPLWKSLPLTYRHVYLTILQHMAFKPINLDDFGLLTVVNPGQLLITERELVKKCCSLEIDKSLVHRSLIKFENIDFSNHKTNQRKTLITITRKDILELIEPNFEPNSNQTRTIKQQREERKEEKNNNKEVGFEVVDDAVVAVGFYKCLENLPLTFENKTVLQEFPEDRVISAIAYATHPTTKIKQDLISTLVWHCKKTEIIQPKELKRTDQQRAAIEYNEALRGLGQEKYYEKNKKLIDENRLFLIMNGIEMPISLNHPIREITKDLNNSLKSIGSSKIVSISA